MNDDSEDIDLLLRRVGQGWRAAEPPTALVPEAAMFAGSASAPTPAGRFLRYAFAAGAVVAVLVVLAASWPQMRPPVAASASGSPNLTSPSAQRSGMVGDPTAVPTHEPVASPALPWRLIRSARLGWNAAYSVSVATTSLEWQEVWDSIDSGTPPPAVDLASEIVATFADGVGSSCPDLDLDDVVIDGANSRIYVVDSNPLGNVPCTADLAGAVVFVVAIERAALPSSPFVVSLTSPDDCTGIPCAAAVEVDLRTPPPATRAVDPTPIAGFSRFEGHNFSFDYPSDWRVIAGFTMYGNGPVVGGAVGIGDFDSGCRWLNEKDLRCDAPSWRIPYEGIVLDYRIEANDGPGPRPSLGPGEQWVDVGGREAVFTETGRSKTWQFSGLPEYIEVHWGAGLAETAPALIDTLIASWQWASLTDR